MRFKKPVRKLPKSTKASIDVNAGEHPQLRFQFSISLEGYEGPLDVLLMLARKQQVDLRQVSIVRLASQYAQFIETAQSLNLELASDYLVMAAWLTFLKSRLLLPEAKPVEGEANPHDIAEQLRFKIVRLNALRKAANYIENLPQLGQKFLVGGVFHAPVEQTIESQDYKDINSIEDTLRASHSLVPILGKNWEHSLYDLLKAYTHQRHASIKRNYAIPVRNVWSLQETREKLSDALPNLHEPTKLSDVITTYMSDKSGEKEIHSATSSTLNAALELAKEGSLQINQQQHNAPVYVNAKQKVG